MKLRATLKSVTDFVDFQIYVRYMYFKALFRRYKTSNMDVRLADFLKFVAFSAANKITNNRG